MDPIYIALQKRYLSICNMDKPPLYNGLPDVRADADMPCPVCGRPIGDHPFDETEIYEGRPIFHLDCNGQRVKL